MAKSKKGGRKKAGVPPEEIYEADDYELVPDEEKHAGQRYDVIWTARKPGKWLIHCHIPHHTSNNNTESKGGGGLMVVINVQ